MLYVYYVCIYIYIYIHTYRRRPQAGTALVQEGVGLVSERLGPGAEEVLSISTCVCIYIYIYVHV